MALPKSGKLVRDRVPQIVAASGGSAVTVTLGTEDFRQALHLKLAEEAEELREAPDDSRLEELADLYEVLIALALAYGQSLQDVIQTADRKRQDRGGFNDRTWMESTSQPTVD